MGTVHALVLAGGTGERLGGASKADLDVGSRLLDVVLAGLAPHVSGAVVVVAPPGVPVPDGVARTMEEPPGGGPLAGIGAGLDFLTGRAGAAGDDRVVVCSVDSPGAGALADRLSAVVLAPHEAGAAIVGGDPEPYTQYLQAVYRVGPLARALDGARAAPGGLHGVGVRRVLGGLVLRRVGAPWSECRDVDTREDLQWWRARLSGGGPG